MTWKTSGQDPWYVENSQSSSTVSVGIAKDGVVRAIAVSTGDEDDGDYIVAALNAYEASSATAEISIVTPGYRLSHWKNGSDELETALDAFWNAAYQQGWQRRGHDDKQGSAQAADTSLRNIIAKLASPAELSTGFDLLKDAIQSVEESMAADALDGEPVDPSRYDVDISYEDAKRILDGMSLVKVVGWQDIGTCPRNQSVILQCRWKHQPHAPYVFEGYLDWDGMTWREQGGGALRAGISDPVYWQPMPIPTPMHPQCDHDWFDCSNSAVKAPTKSCRKCGWTVHGEDEARGLFIEWPWLTPTKTPPPLESGEGAKGSIPQA
ncbi:hypothetical protein [Rhizobium sp. 2MFCol3.1]|uniref:hypothetical protein n=1 Tax=Rhizobium sp. 2MFCol3.1 TaxID=1246459 RepID=UPI00036C90D9|nr:hypothetical protein [Rhizobium sp. 2MFCol3.1]